MTKTIRKIPNFKRYEEEAAFWDTHDVTDYFDLKPVNLKVANPLQHAYTITFEKDVDAQLAQLAVKRKTDVIRLIKHIVKKSLPTFA
jgi:hypothetical protein